MSMFSRFFGKVRDVFLPFQSIASELRILRELYEQELSECKPPIIRQTDTPRRHDTTVMFSGEESRPKSVLDKLKTKFQEDVDDDIV